MKKIKLAKTDAAFVMRADHMEVYFPSNSDVNPGFMMTFIFASSNTKNVNAARALIQAELEMMTRTAYNIEMPKIKSYGTN